MRHPIPADAGRDEQALIATMTATVTAVLGRGLDG